MISKKNGEQGRMCGAVVHVSARLPLDYSPGSIPAWSHLCGLSLLLVLTLLTEFLSQHFGFSPSLKNQHSKF